MSSGSKAPESNPCFVLVSEPGRDASDPSQLLWTCTLCPSSIRLISRVSLKGHLRTKGHLASLKRKAENEMKEAEARKEKTPMKPRAPKIQTFTGPTKQSGTRPTASLVQVAPLKRPPILVTASSAPAPIAGKSGPVYAAGAAKIAAETEEAARKKVEVEDRKKAAVRRSAELVVSKEDDEPRRKLNRRHIKQMRDETAFAECLKRAEDLVKVYLTMKRDPSHDWQHVNRVRRLALDIAKSLGSADLKIIELLALFHGLAVLHIFHRPTGIRASVYADTAAKSSQCADLPNILAPFLSHPSTTRSLTFAQVLVIQTLVPLVSWEAEKLLRDKKEWSAWHDSSIELKAVQDADRLDGMGAVGLMRTVAADAKEGRVLFGGGTIEGKESVESRIKREQLILKSGMKTDFGKAEAHRRHKTMRAWFATVHAETQSAPL